MISLNYIHSTHQNASENRTNPNFFLTFWCAFESFLYGGSHCKSCENHQGVSFWRKVDGYGTPVEIGTPSHIRWEVRFRSVSPTISFSVKICTFSPKIFVSNLYGGSTPENFLIFFTLSRLKPRPNFFRNLNFPMLCHRKPKFSPVHRPPYFAPLLTFWQLSAAVVLAIHQNSFDFD